MKTDRGSILVSSRKCAILCAAMAPKKRQNPADPKISGVLVSKAGSDLLSHSVATAVPSALESLTSEFGMGSGVASPL